jgi:hypothetical protein
MVWQGSPEHIPNTSVPGGVPGSARRVGAWRGAGVCRAGGRCLAGWLAPAGCGRAPAVAGRRRWPGAAGGRAPARGPPAPRRGVFPLSGDRSHGFRALAHGCRGEWTRSVIRQRFPCTRPRGCRRVDRNRRLMTVTVQSPTGGCASGRKPLLHRGSAGAAAPRHWAGWWPGARGVPADASPARAVQVVPAGCFPAAAAGVCRCGGGGWWRSAGWWRSPGRLRLRRPATAGGGRAPGGGRPGT